MEEHHISICGGPASDKPTSLSSMITPPRGKLYPVPWVDPLSDPGDMLLTATPLHMSQDAHLSRYFFGS